MPRKNGSSPRIAAPDRVTPLVQPFADTWEAHQQAGWTGIIPLPPGKKGPPPSGTTGHSGVDPTPEQCAQRAADEPASNIGWRLPQGVVGIDVDAYGDKNGGKTLAQAQARWGKLPDCARSTSRDDGVSGIRFYRVPEGTRLRGGVAFPELGLGCIDVIQHHHRYAVVPPSVHPGTKLPYVWRNGSTKPYPSRYVPSVSELPDLPAEWVQALRVDNQASDVAGAAPEAVAKFIAAIPDGQPCEKVRNHLQAALQKLGTGGEGRHDAALGAVLTLLRQGHDGHPGVPDALEQLQAEFVSSVTADGSRDESSADCEFGRMVDGPRGIALLASTPTPESARVCRCPDGPGAPTGDTGDEGHQKELAREVRRERVRTEARDIVRREQAARSRPEMPPLRVLTDLLAEADEETSYLVQSLWPTGGNVVLSAQFKAGKTVLSHNLVRALVDGSPFLDRFPVRPLDGRVVLLDTELGEPTARRWLRDQGTRNTDKVTHVSLRGAAGALNLLDPQARSEWAAKLREAECEVLVLDPAAPALAASGLSESKNEDVARFLLWWDQLVAEAGVSESMVIHHMGHSQERARGASRWRDWPDAEWLLVRGDDEQPDDTDPEAGSTDPRAPRFLSAYGRDVDVSEVDLAYDSEARHLSVPTASRSRKDIRGATGQALKAEEAARLQARVAEFVKRKPGANTEVLRKAGFGKHDRVRGALDALITEGLVRVEKQGSALCYFVVAGEANP